MSTKAPTTGLTSRSVSSLRLLKGLNRLFKKTIKIRKKSKQKIGERSFGIENRVRTVEKFIEDVEGIFQSDGVKYC